MSVPRPTQALVVLLAALVGCSRGDGQSQSADPPPAPVAAAPVAVRSITLRRTFSGALEASAEVTVAPRVGGQLRRLAVDIGDEVQRGQVVAWIDDAELRQSVAQAEAEGAVARANVEEAVSSAEIADRALERIRSLHGDGVASESELDAARTAALARRSRVAVTEAQTQRAEASLEAARLRLAESTVSADWADDTGERRLVGRRFVDEGTNVAAGSPILSIVALQPMVAVIFVPERDYARLAAGQPATLETDAYPGERFAGVVARVAPVFSRNTRQVRVELEVENSDLRLKPGMFVRASLDLGVAEDATVVPYAALTSRRGESGVFVLEEADQVVRWRPVRAGIREGDFIEVLGDGVVGRVVTLGQELCDDGSRVSVVSSEGAAVGAAARVSHPAGDL